MATMFKRLFWLALLGGAAFAVWSMLQRRQSGPPTAEPEWPPLDTTDGSATPAAPSAFADVGARETADDAQAATAEPVGVVAPEGGEAPAAGAADAAWVAPVEGACPASHPIKANDNSGIFHMPGGRFYDRTGAERCYACAEDAEADGYRAAKS